METLPIDPTIAAHIAADIAKFETVLAQFLAGEVEEDVFRIFRLNNGIYGQRQGGHNQMVRVKVPYGSLDPEQLEMLGRIGDKYSRGWGHITTRQNIQFHFVPLERIPEVMRDLASVGLNTREACGDTVRNVTGCHLAGACPFEVLDISPWAEATYRHFLHHPYGQRLPRKFKINFSGCATDCGQAMFNDVGVVAVGQPREDGTVEPGFRVFVAGGLGANPHAALGAGAIHRPRRAAGDHRGVPAHLRPLRQPGQQAAGPDEVAGRHHRHRRAAPPGAEGAQDA